MPPAARVGDMHTCPLSDGPKPHVGGPVCQGVTMSRVVERLDEQRRSVGDFFGDETHIVCPWHGYEFDLRTGRHPADPGIRLRRYPVHERDGEIVVEF